MKHMLPVKCVTVETVYSLVVCTPGSVHLLAMYLLPCYPSLMVHHWWLYLSSQPCAMVWPVIPPIHKATLNQFQEVIASIPGGVIILTWHWQRQRQKGISPRVGTFTNSDECMHLDLTALSIYPVSRWSRGDSVSWSEGSVCGLPVLYGLSVSLVHTSCGLEMRLYLLWEKRDHELPMLLRLLSMALYLCVYMYVYCMLPMPLPVESWMNEWMDKTACDQLENEQTKVLYSRIAPPP